MEPNLERFMSGSSSGAAVPSFSGYINALLSKRDEPAERVINRADIERSFGHQLFSGRRKPSRDTAIQLAFGFEMGYEEAQELLRIARKSALYPKVKRDMVIIYCLHNGLGVVECQMALQKYGLPLLGEGNRNE
jgi:hypothetical protein